MADDLALVGYRFSVYTRIVRAVLHLKGLEYRTVEVDPFAVDPPPLLRDLHPFGRVPVLQHGAFSLYETTAITRYLDQISHPLSLCPYGARDQARMQQVIGMVDAYVYWPMVRQIFSHRVFRAASGGQGDEAEIENGLIASHKALHALETIATEGLVLNTDDVTLADCHLAPMIGYFVQSPEGADALAAYPALSKWWASRSNAAFMAATDPGLPGRVAD